MEQYSSSSLKFNISPRCVVAAVFFFFLQMIWEYLYECTLCVCLCVCVSRRASLSCCVLFKLKWYMHANWMCLSMLLLLHRLCFILSCLVGACACLMSDYISLDMCAVFANSQLCTWCDTVLTLCLLYLEFFFSFDFVLSIEERRGDETQAEKG